ncbi:hypothetical protein NQ318_008528 [Aromia moschata]|uniref:Uncharacterized protein n=1 Tax=Aromia moschata TaxID=1265417 RepID=A0AAV8XQ57_9CUCU|nr:hypothetical protein NQ318_008528 [Aromia moschata]
MNRRCLFQPFMDTGGNGLINMRLGSYNILTLGIPTRDADDPANDRGNNNPSDEGRLWGKCDGEGVKGNGSFDFIVAAMAAAAVRPTPAFVTRLEQGSNSLIDPRVHLELECGCGTAAAAADAHSTARRGGGVRPSVGASAAPRSPAGQTLAPDNHDQQDAEYVNTSQDDTDAINTVTKSEASNSECFEWYGGFKRTTARSK